MGKCYQKLYEKKIVEDCEIEEIVNKIQTLSDEEVNNTEGKITLKEATRALKNMKKKEEVQALTVLHQSFSKCLGNNLNILL